MKLTNPARGDWMQTYTGKMFFPADPRPEDIDILDIAQGLSNVCRYNGQCNTFYSVAEHSIHVSLCVPAEDAFAALMHDATEAYVCDIPRPLKAVLGSAYGDVEAGVWNAIVGRFTGLPTKLPATIKYADNAVLMAEAAQILGKHPAPWGVDVPAADIKVNCWTPKTARTKFLERFVELYRFA